jgi:predicted dehydrogenase
MTREREEKGRREFMKKMAGFSAAPLVLPAATLGLGNTPPPSERITAGIIGLGARGFNLLGDFLREKDLQVTALCDVDKLHYRDAEWGEGRPCGLEPAAEEVKKRYRVRFDKGAWNGVDQYADYREVCGRKDIDMIVCATPDHWHALCTLTAIKAGKDVYCEKPVTHFFREGQRVYKAVAAKKAVFQAGSQQRSDPLFRHVVELVLNGHLGRIKYAEVGLGKGYNRPMGNPAVKEAPEHLDYDFWCGPGPVLPYMRARHHRWWRGHRGYGGGVLMDWIGHHNDITHWALGMDKAGPIKAEAVGWTPPETDIYNTPHLYTIRCEYPGGITSAISTENELGLKIVGEDGWVYARRGHLEASDVRWKKRSFDPGPVKAYDSPGHVRNFLDCVRSRKACVAPAETAHRSITPGHLGYVSHELGRALAWDPEKEIIPGDEEANTLLNAMSFREPWELPEV